MEFSINSGPNLGIYIAEKWEYTLKSHTQRQGHNDFKD